MKVYHRSLLLSTLFRKILLYYLFCCFMISIIYEKAVNE